MSTNETIRVNLTLPKRLVEAFDKVTDNRSETVRKLIAGMLKRPKLAESNPEGRPSTRKAKAHVNGSRKRTASAS